MCIVTERWAQSRFSVNFSRRENPTWLEYEMGLWSALNGFVKRSRSSLEGRSGHWHQSLICSLHANMFVWSTVWGQRMCHSMQQAMAVPAYKFPKVGSRAEYSVVFFSFLSELYIVMVSCFQLLLGKKAWVLNLFLDLRYILKCPFWCPSSFTGGIRQATGSSGLSVWVPAPSLNSCTLYKPFDIFGVERFYYL